MKTFIYFIRHGESIANAKDIILGHSDWDLSEMGFKQAKCTAEALRNVEFSAIYSSDLLRASHTAEPNATIRDMKVKVSMELREIYFGDWEIAKHKELRENTPQIYSGYTERFGTFQAPNGEKMQDLVDRILKKTINIAKMHEGTNILIACHGCAIRSLWGRIAGVKPEDISSKVPYPRNASYTVFSYEDGKLFPESFSNDKHLIAANLSTKP